MLAIVHSYVTHKTGRTSSGRGRGHPSLQPHPQASGLTLGPSEAVLGPSSEQKELGAGPRCKAVTTGVGVLGLVHPVRATGSHPKVRLERLGGIGLGRFLPLLLTHSPTTAHLALSFLVKEEEKQKLLQRGSELQSEHQQLEERDRRLASAVKVRWGRGGGALPLAAPGVDPERPHAAAEAP